MNYTKTIREFCLQNKGEIFDVSYMKDEYFEMVPYKTLLQIMSRLEKEGIVECVSKGVYLICEEGRDFDDAIVERYISNGHGMYAGNTLFNDLGITDQKEAFTEVYTNRLSVRFKTIGSYQLTKVDVPFSPQVVSLINLLECIEKGFSAAGVNIVNVVKLNEAITSLAKEYTDTTFTVIISVMPYHYATIVTLKELLDKIGIENDCLTIFERYNK